jgi:hypothetical protein
VRADVGDAVNSSGDVGGVRRSSIAWDAIELHREFSSRQLAIIVLFAEAARMRSRVKRHRLRIPLRGIPAPIYGVQRG